MMVRLLLFVGLYLFSGFIKAQSLSAWSARETIQITEQTGTTLLDYQVKIVVLFNTGMQVDFADIRFADSDSSSLLSHWCEYFEAGVSATFWVKIPVLSAGVQKNIFMYFDNPIAQSASNGTNTFDFYSDMSQTAAWNTIGGGFVSADSTSFPGLKMIRKQGSCDPSGAWIDLNTTLSSFRLIAREMRPQFSSNNNCKWNRYGLEDNTFNGYSLRRKADVNTVGEFGMERRNNGGYSNVRQTVLPQPKNQFYYTELTKDCLSGQMQVVLRDNLGYLIGNHQTIDHAYCNFSRFVLRGGVDYRIDHVAVGQYVEQEPTVTFTNQLILLSVDLNYFEVETYEEGHLIKWGVNHVDDISTFELQNSLDAVQFETIQGFSVDGFNYEILDKEYYPPGQVYYRLKTTLIDGSISYSPIKVVEVLNAQQGVTLAPNPTAYNLKVTFTANTNNVTQIMVMDNNGRTVKMQQYQFDVGVQQVDIDLAELPAGMYHLIIADGIQHRIRRFIKQ